MKAGTKRKAAYMLIAAVMMLLFSFPMLSAVNQFTFIWGIPVMYLYLFIVWGLGILILFIITAFRKAKNKPKV